MAEKIDRLFRFDMYPADWMMDTSRLTPEECGLYIQIVCLIYARRGPIENDPEELSRKLKDCSIRKARSIISSLVRKEFVTLSGEKISQKRAEIELNSKRNHLESSAKGGRNRHENKSGNKENNDINSSDTPDSPPSPSHLKSISISTAIEDDLKNDPEPLPKTTPKINHSDFSVLDILDPDGFTDARVFASVAGQDLNSLAKTFDHAIRTGIMERPRNPNKAFPAWIQRITPKGKTT